LARRPWSFLALSHHAVADTVTAALFLSAAEFIASSEEYFRRTAEAPLAHPRPGTELRHPLQMFQPSFQRCNTRKSHAQPTQTHTRRKQEGPLQNSRPAGWLAG
ncbi:unnamed protein product, partial [Ectocarpus sp. 12 AP-2014]